MTRKELLALANKLNAKDITNEHSRIENINCIVCSYGTYGRNAMILSNDEKLV